MIAMALAASGRARMHPLLLAPLLLSACFSSEPLPPEPNGGTPAVVEMTDALAFDPSPVTIAVGETVEWRNASSVPHTATADPSLAADPANVILPAGAEPFHSGILTAGARFRHTFTVAGTYRYVCLPHESAGMIGTVVVNPE